MARHIKCGKLFTGLGDGAQEQQTLVFEGDIIKFVGPSAAAPKPAPGDEVVDCLTHDSRKNPVEVVGGEMADFRNVCERNPGVEIAFDVLNDCIDAGFVGFVHAPC